ncbi:MAG: M48 family metallopeptidase [Oscillospiraceae bacterium]|nr:M48 family metallopeptidase [Oscillospiraceae bacterium]
MIKEIFLNGTKIQYDLQYKKVKNINLRIKSDGTVHVSANKRVSQKVIESFVLSKAFFIQKALEEYEKRSSQPQKQYFAGDEICNLITGLCEKVYPYFEKRGVKYPQIKFRRMISRWGSCQPIKGILTFNTNLMYAPKECIEYVVAHEFTHFLQANHSSKFYEELAVVCPDWKVHKERLKEIYIR